METEFRPGFGQLVRAICRHEGLEAGPVVQTWTRTSVRNEAELSSIAQQSAGVISRKTILSNHPWVTDAEKELEQLKEEEQEENEKLNQQGYNPFAQQGKKTQEAEESSTEKEGSPGGEGENV